MYAVIGEWLFGPDDGSERGSGLCGGPSHMPRHVIVIGHGLSRKVSVSVLCEAGAGDLRKGGREQ